MIFDARFLLALFEGVYVLAAGTWLGAMVFFSFGVAPIIFRVLEPEAAARFVRRLFPTYYAFGLGAAVVALTALVARALCFEELRGLWVGIQALAWLVAIGGLFYCRETLTPAINKARDAKPEQTERFGRLHRESVAWNLLLMGLAGALLVGFAVRPAPTTRGIQEMSPEERARAQLEFFMRMNQPLNRENPTPPDAAKQPG